METLATKTRLLTAIAFVLISTAVNGQSSTTQTPNLQTFIPPSPNASSLGKYGEIPVGYYTGIPNISIPIHNIKSRDLSLPINLSYHAGGIRVEEIASWVGLGWSLNAGGAITRTTRGLPDDMAQGYIENRVNISNMSQYYSANPSTSDSYTVFSGNGKTEDVNYLEGVIGGMVDSAPDVFYFNFGNYSGKFFFTDDGSIAVSPIQTIKIEYQTRTVPTTEGVTQWKVTTPDGVQYIFGSSLELTQSTPSYSQRSALETNNNGGLFIPVTAWYLIEILSPTGDRIDFFYNSESYNYDTKSSEVLNLQVASGPLGGVQEPLPSHEAKITKNFFSGVVLSRITFANGDISFNPGTRDDLKQASLLQSIDINCPQMQKRFDFTYGYYQTHGACRTEDQYVNYCTRLRLDGIEETSLDKTATNGKHRFLYEGTALPPWDPQSLDINSQDLWGFYNGVFNTVLPVSFSVQLVGGAQGTLMGADRHADESYMKAGVLTHIIYPTGGSVQFDYEANKVYSSDADYSFVNFQPESKSEFLVINTGQTQSETFSVVYPNPVTGMVDVKVTNMQMIQVCPTENGFPACWDAYIEGINGTSFQKTKLPANVTTMQLLPGDYQMSITSDATLENQYLSTSNTGAKDPLIYRLELDWTEYPPTTTSNGKSDKVVGGLRVQRITTSSGNDTQVKKYLYNNFNDANSSASLVSFPKHFAQIFRYVQGIGGAANNSIQILTTDYAQVSSTPQIPLVPTQGSSVGYANVTELDGENGENGKTEFTFTTAVDFPDEIRDYRPYPQPGSFDWRRGLLKLKTTYSNNQTGYIPVQQVSSTYSSDASTRITYGFSVAKDYYSLSPGTILPGNSYYVGVYKTISEFFYNQTETTRSFDGNNPNIYSDIVRTFTYGSPYHKFLTKTSSNNSRQQLVVETTQYAQDVTLSGQAETDRQSLVSSFRVNTVMEQDETVDSAPTYKTVHNYKNFGSVPFLESIDHQIGTNPIEKRVVISNYDGSGNVLQQSMKDGVQRSYIWDYNNAYPIAEVVNAASTDIAHTSFEADGSGNWTLSGGMPDNQNSFTGNSCMNFTGGTLASGPLVNGTRYTVSFWALPGASFALNGNALSPTGRTRNGWSYYETTLVAGANTLSVTITGSGEMDDVRLFPSGAQMTTYTYSPEVGMTSKTDPNNTSTMFVHDAIGRLVEVRDHDRKLVKTYNYHIKGQDVPSSH